MPDFLNLTLPLMAYKTLNVKIIQLQNYKGPDAKMAIYAPLLLQIQDQTLYFDKKGLLVQEGGIYGHFCIRSFCRHTKSTDEFVHHWIWRVVSYEIYSVCEVYVYSKLNY